MAGEVIAEHAAIAAVLHALEKIRKVRFLKYRILRPKADMRVSFAALLRVSDGGRYLLVRNFHRPEVYGPLGGVFKYYDDAKRDLDELLFRPQDLGPGSDMKNDLRGFIPRGNLWRLSRWYVRGEGREAAAECLRRELREELRKETRLSSKLTIPDSLHLRKVRVVEEGPEKVPGQTYLQYRVFEVYEASPNSMNVLRFTRQLFDAAKEDPHLLVVSAAEIVTGRAHDRRLIGHHAAYLIGRKRIRPEEAPLVSN